MNLTLIEICRTDDKYASYYLNANKAQGFDVFKHRGQYVTFFMTERTWKSPTAEFKSVRSGTYVLKNNEFVRI